MDRAESWALREEVVSSAHECLVCLNVRDVASVLEQQLGLHDEGTPRRFVFMSSTTTGDWVRHDLATIPTNTTLQTEFKSLLDVAGGVTDVEAQQIVS